MMVEKMKNDANPVFTMIKRSNRNILLLSLGAVLIAVVAFGALSAPYFIRQFTGPHPITTEELAAIPAGAENMYWVEVTGTELLDSGFYEYTTENGVQTTTDAYFAVTFIGEEKILLVRQKNVVVEETGEVKLVGTLTTPTSISKDVYDQILAETPDIAPFMLPVVLDTVDDTFTWYLGGGALALLFVAGLIGLFVFMSRSRDIGNHPILRDLRPVGEPMELVDQIYNERTMSEQQITKNASITRNWFVYQAGNDMKAARLNDLTWIYKQVVQNKYGKNYFAHIWDRHGRMLQVGGNEAQVNDILNALGSRAPWVVGGHSNDIQQSWNKNRAEFIASVDARRRDMNA